MKKKILFVIPSLGSGGAEKSLISVLSLFDYEKYEVDLLLFRREGLFFEKIPGGVSMLYDTTDYEMFDGSAKDAIKYFAGKLRFSMALDRIKYARIFSENDADIRDEKLWSILKKILPKLTKKYDCAIGYLEGNANSFVTECVNADKKICYVHNDVKKLPHSTKQYAKAFEKADKVVTVSDVCLKSLEEEFPDFSDKFCVIENITGKELVRAESESEGVYEKDKNETVILTVGRCSEQKNIPLAVDACAELVKRQRHIKWYHIGKGELEQKVKDYVSEKQLDGTFIMLGERSNPYPYIAQCDIYVQPSKFEGKSIAIDEVKCLARPIVVTDFSTVYDQIQDGVNGLICKMTAENMAERIEELMNNPSLMKTLTGNLEEEETGNESEINKIYALIES